MERKSSHNDETAMNLWRPVDTSRPLSLVGRQCTRFSPQGSAAHQPAPLTAITYIAA